MHMTDHGAIALFKDRGPTRLAVRLAGVIAATAICLAASPVQAKLLPWTIDPGYFNGPDNGITMPSTSDYGFVHGSQVNDEFHNLLPGLDVNVSARRSGGSITKAVVFDTHKSNTRDRDLEDRFKQPNSNAKHNDYSGPAPEDCTQVLVNGELQCADLGDSLERPGNVFIVQENEEGCDEDGVCDEPDDNQDGGILTFVFSMPVSIESLNLFDADGAPQDEYVTLKYFQDGSNTPVSEQISSFGDNAAIRHAVNNGNGFDDVTKLVVWFSSSGAVDYITGTKDVPTDLLAVNEPMTIGLLGSMLAFVGWRRRNG